MILEFMKYDARIHETVEIFVYPYKRDHEEGFSKRLTGNQARRREVKQVTYFNTERPRNTLQRVRLWPAFSQLQGGDTTGTEADARGINLAAHPRRIPQFPDSCPELRLKFGHRLSVGGFNNIENDL